MGEFGITWDIMVVNGIAFAGAPFDARGDRFNMINGSLT
jgi:hypothetical protein